MTEAIDFAKWLLSEFPGFLPVLALALLAYGIYWIGRKTGPPILKYLRVNQAVIQSNISAFESMETQVLGAIAKNTDALRKIGKALGVLLTRTKRLEESVKRLEQK